jgi:hypothetical protein
MTVRASQMKQVEPAAGPWSGFRPGLCQSEINVRDLPTLGC